MHEDHEQLDDELGRLASSLRAGDHMLACLQLAEFTLKLDHLIRCEERTLKLAYHLVDATPSLTFNRIQREHTSLRELVAAVATALDAADDRRGAELVGKLRSVLMLHVTKEQLLRAPVISYSVH